MHGFHRLSLCSPCSSVCTICSQPVERFNPLLERALVVANEVHTHAEVDKRFTRPRKRVISTYTYIITQLTVRRDVGRSNHPTHTWIHGHSVVQAGQRQMKDIVHCI